MVLGLGDTGLSMTRWLVRHGANVRVADSRQHPPHASVLERELPEVPLMTGGFGEIDLKEIDVVAVSPGVNRREPPVSEALRRGVPVVGDVELFAQALPPASSSKVIAITGANGKSTVTAMTGDMCVAAGMSTVLAGNIGLPVLDVLSAIESGGDAPEAFVLELSSFQLESTQSLNPDAATVLNLTPDHMDRYDDMADYAAAKARIFNGSGTQVLNRGDPWSAGMARPGRAVLTFAVDTPRRDDEWGLKAVRNSHWLACGERELFPLNDLPVAGLHNAANALAALALCSALHLPEAPQLDALRRFRGLPHRVQKVGEAGGVTFYDDSKGTNVGATIAALRGMTRPTVLIAGGDGKQQDFGALAPAVTGHARAVVLIGRDGGRIARALARCGVPLIHAQDMDGAVNEAFGAARPGDAVLLSPACASYDMYRDYVHRAEVFVHAVDRLVERRG